MTENNSETALTPIKESANMVVQYARKIVGDERAKEFVTRLAIMAKESPNIAICEPESVVTSMMACVHLDLMPNTVEQYAFVIPYKNWKNGKYYAQFQIGYKGLAELAYRTGLVMDITAELVFAQDEFKASFGTKRELIHEPNFDIDRTDASKVIRVYATAAMQSGATPFVVLSMSEVEKVKGTVKAKSDGTPWKDWEEAMIKKTAVIRLAKLLPKSSKDKRLAMAVYADGLASVGKLKVNESGELAEADDKVTGGDEPTDKPNKEIKSFAGDDLRKNKPEPQEGEIVDASNTTDTDTANQENTGSADDKPASPQTAKRGSSSTAKPKALPVQPDLPQGESGDTDSGAEPSSDGNNADQDNDAGEDQQPSTEVRDTGAAETEPTPELEPDVDDGVRELDIPDLIEAIDSMFEYLAMNKFDQMRTIKEASATKLVALSKLSHNELVNLYRRIEKMTDKKAEIDADEADAKRAGVDKQLGELPQVQTAFGDEAKEVK